MAEAEGGGGEFVGDAGIDGGIVAAVAINGVFAEQGGEKFVVSDGLNLGDHLPAAELIELLVGKGRIFRGQGGGDAVVFADEECL